MKNRGVSVVSGFMLVCSALSLHSITFFNLTQHTLELHVRMDSVPEPTAMHALLYPHTNVTWQAPQAPKAQLTIAAQQYKVASPIKPQEDFIVRAEKTPTVPSFSPWQKTASITIKPASYERDGLLGMRDCVFIRQTTQGNFIATTVGRQLGLAAMQRYSKTLLSAQVKKSKSR